MESEASAKYDGVEDSAAQKSSRSVSDCSLLGLLGADIDRLNALQRTQNATIAAQHLDEKRTHVMLRLAQEQLERGKESYQRLQQQYEQAIKRVAELESSVSTSIKDQSGYLQQLEVSKIKLRNTMQENNVERAALQSQVDIAEEKSKTLRNELSKYQGVLLEVQQQNQLLQQKLILAETRVASAEEETKITTDIRQKEILQHTVREHELNKQIVELKETVSVLETSLASERTNAHEVTMKLKVENEANRLKFSEAEKAVKRSELDATVSLSNMKEELRAIQESKEREYFSAQQREKQLKEENAHLTTSLRMAQSEINALATKDVCDKQRLLDDMVKLQSERDVHLMRIAHLERDAIENADKARLHLIELRTQIQLAKQEKTCSDELHAVASAQHAEEVARLKNEIAVLHQQLSEEVLKHEQVVESHLDKQRSSAAQILSLKAEIEGYHQTVDKLDKHIKDDKSRDHLRDEIEELQMQNDQLRTQVSRSNSALANARIEAEIIKNSRLTTMEERFLLQQVQVAETETEIRVARPLIKDMLELLQARDDASASPKNIQDHEASIVRDAVTYLKKFSV